MGLFAAPTSLPIDQNHPLVKQVINSLSSGYQLPGFTGDEIFCPPGYIPNAFGGCDRDPFDTSLTGGGLLSSPDDGGSNSGGTTLYDNSGNPITINITNNNKVLNDGIDKITDAVLKGITDAQNQTDDLVKRIRDNIEHAIAEEADGITQGINNASDNLATSIKVTSAATAATTAATAATVTKSITDQIDAVKNTITPLLSSITSFIDKVNAEVQKVNDTLISPIVNLYNTTVGEISTLTKAIETDLKEGISGLLKLPGQVADQIGSFDATLNRTVQQMGTINKETVTSSIDYLNAKFPEPFSAALSQALTGKTLANSLTTTFTDKQKLSSESLRQVSAEAISGLGTLLGELLSITGSTFESSLNNLHANWSSVESVFTGLLDGALSLLTTLTSIGVLASPLISAAEQEANKLVPVTKLDPGTVIGALRRGFIDTVQAISELRTKGYDETRAQVLIDMSVFLADSNQALDWWYRGIINDEDLIANLRQHGFEPEDITALKQGSIRLPGLAELTRWLNFGILTQEQFIANCKAIRYDDAQIQAILQTYRERETPQTLSALSGILNNSSAGFINNTLSQPVPDAVRIAGERAGYHPDLIQYIWLAHWQLPSVEAFTEMYFRGFRTRTELEQRMAMANIPKELWEDMIEIKRPLLPLRMIPSAYSKGLITLPQAETELRSHGHNELHIQMILQAYAPKTVTAPAGSTDALHALSLGNAKTLWNEGAITDEQYVAVLVAHGYSADVAALQLKGDQVAKHIKDQKQELNDLTEEVLAGAMDGDTAIQQLNTHGFTDAQISAFVNNINRKLRVNTKTPSIAELNKFLKAQIIDINTYAQGIQALGWQEPWLTYWVQLAGGTDDNADQ